MLELLMTSRSTKEFVLSKPDHGTLHSQFHVCRSSNPPPPQKNTHKGQATTNSPPTSALLSPELSGLPRAKGGAMSFCPAPHCKGVPLMLPFLGSSFSYPGSSVWWGWGGSGQGSGLGGC